MKIRTFRSDTNRAHKRVLGNIGARKSARLSIGAGIGFLKNFVIVGLALAVFYGSWHWMANSQYLCLNKILVEGGRHISHEELLRLTGLTSRVNLLKIDLKSVAAAIEKYPWVERASLRRKWPNQLIVAIKERTPVAILNSNNKMYLVDRSGCVFKEMSPGDAGPLPVITGVAAGDLKDNKLSGTAKKAIELIAMASQGARTLGANNIKEIHIVDTDNLIVYTADHGVPIHFQAQDLKTQFARAEKILFQLYRSGNYERATKVELNYGPDMAIAKLRD